MRDLPIGINFSGVIIKYLLRKPLDITDMDLIDPELLRNLRYILEKEHIEEEQHPMIFFDKK